jgi:hypothetical protein
VRAEAVTVATRDPQWLRRISHRWETVEPDDLAREVAVEQWLREWRESRGPLQVDAETAAKLHELLDRDPPR